MPIGASPGTEVPLSRVVDVSEESLRDVPLQGGVPGRLVVNGPRTEVVDVVGVGTEF